MALKKRLEEKKQELDAQQYMYHSSIRETKVWISQNGRETLYKNMDSNHIRNIVKKFGKDLTKYDIAHLKNELIYRKMNEAIPSVKKTAEYSRNRA